MRPAKVHCSILLLYNQRKAPVRGYSNPCQFFGLSCTLSLCCGLHSSSEREPLFATAASQVFLDSRCFLVYLFTRRIAKTSQLRAPLTAGH